MTDVVEIVGAGLAGCCLAWRLRERGLAVRLVDDLRPGGASRVAAGLVNPVTGRNFEPSWRIGEFLPEAVEFFGKVGSEMDRQLWFPHPVRRLFSGKEWQKAERKLVLPGVAEWIGAVEENVDGWRAVVTLKGGGRVDTRAFCEGTAEVFGLEDRGRDGVVRVRCGGAFDLMNGLLGGHRCAKGEILTVETAEADPTAILIGGGGWLVPLGAGRFKAGATYEWDTLDGVPTEAGRLRVEGILRALGIGRYGITAHEAGVRPIVRRSMPLIGKREGDWVFNGLGSKGSLYAPGVARRLVDWLVDGVMEDESLVIAPQP